MHAPALVMQGTENEWIDQVLEPRTNVEGLCANLFAGGVHPRTTKCGGDVDCGGSTTISCTTYAPGVKNTGLASYALSIKQAFKART
jgi:hypothetical protein